MFLVAIISSCKQDLCKYDELSDHSSIKASVDWSESNIDPTNIHNLSIYAYPEGGDAPYLKVSGDVESATINLLDGFYSLLIFNDVVEDIAGLKFENSDSYDEFLAKIVETTLPTTAYYSMASDEVLATTHGQLATWHMDQLEVIVDTEVCPYCGELHNEQILIDVVPTPTTTICSFRVYVDNLNNAQTIQGVVKGFAAGAYLLSGDRISMEDKTVIYSFSFTSATYTDEKSKDGYVEAQIITFGKVPDASQTYELELDIILNNGELEKFTRDITDQVMEQENVKILITLESDDDKITLPDGDGTGFGVEAWGEKEAILLI